MGDGMSDSGWRGELGPDGNEKWLLDKVTHENPMVMHERSVLMLNHADTLKRLEEGGKVSVTRRDDWLEIFSQR